MPEGKPERSGYYEARLRGDGRYDPRAAVHGHRYRGGCLSGPHIEKIPAQDRRAVFLRVLRLSFVPEDGKGRFQHAADLEVRKKAAAAVHHLVGTAPVPVLLEWDNRGQARSSARRDKLSALLFSDRQLRPTVVSARDDIRRTDDLAASVYKAIAREDTVRCRGLLSAGAAGADLVRAHRAIERGGARAVVAYKAV